MEKITQDSRNNKTHQENPPLTLHNIQESADKKLHQQNANQNTVTDEKTKKIHQENPKLNITNIQESRNQNKPNQEKPNLKLYLPHTKKHQVWDCDSNLYDSFELKSFERQLNSAIHSRTLSMPHLADRRVAVAETMIAPPPFFMLPQPSAASKKPSKISRSFNKFIKSMFKSKQNNTSLFRVQDRSADEYYVVYDKSGALCTIPEVPEIDFGGFSPEINSLVRRTESERFSATSVIGISCA